MEMQVRVKQKRGEGEFSGRKEAAEVRRNERDGHKKEGEEIEKRSSCVCVCV